MPTRCPTQREGLECDVSVGKGKKPTNVIEVDDSSYSSKEENRRRNKGYATWKRQKEAVRRAAQDVARAADQPESTAQRMLNRAGQVIRSTANALTTPAGLLLGLTLLAIVAGDSRMQVVENKLSGGNHPTLHLAEGIAYERKTEVDINVNYVMVHRELNTTAWIKGLAALQKIISEHDKFCSSYKNMAQATKKQSSQFVAITVPDYRYNVSNWEGRCEQLSLALPEVREDNEKYELWALMKRHKLTFIPAGLEWDQAEDYPLFMSDKKSARDRGGMDKICSQEANSDWHSLTPYTDNGKKQWIYQDWCTNGDAR